MVLQSLLNENSSQACLLKSRDDLVCNLQEELEEAKEQIASLDSELVDARLAVARANRKVRSGQTGQSDNHDDGETLKSA
ncbi:hypothetical protein ccbrp13_42010 [Ktedonobacteria bacterium brp13]|nr:hypothetical protein ccbrp13_42010 [Ktedonobacteria bacterium brp13]